MLFFWLILLANLQWYLQIFYGVFWYIGIESSPTISINLQKHENNLISECTKCEIYVISHIKYANA